MQQTIQQIKADLRAMMNGVAAAAMRNAGMTADYRTNFGVELPRLRQLAGELATNDDTAMQQLAQALWKEPVRECRILATMLYPPQLMQHDIADIWLSQTNTTELLQIAALNLWNHIPQAAEKAFQWIAADDDKTQTAGYYTLIHLLRRTQLSPRSEQELRDQINTAIDSQNPQLSNAAHKLLLQLNN